MDDPKGSTRAGLENELQVERPATAGMEESGDRALAEFEVQEQVAVWSGGELAAIWVPREGSRYQWRLRVERAVADGKTIAVVPLGRLGRAGGYGALEPILWC